jgi:two-component system, NtrC family, sensor histidine kinase HydH
MKENDVEIKSLILGPTIILSIVFLIMLLNFLFWIVEDVSDSEDAILKTKATYLTEIIKFTGNDSLKNLTKILDQYSKEINDDDLVFTFWDNEKIIYQYPKRADLKQYDLLYNYNDRFVWYYYHSDFLHRSTYVIPYSFRKHATITWITIILIIAAIWFSRFWINRNRKVNRMFILNEQWSRMGRITTGLLHEIRNPLNAINVNTQLIEEDIVVTSIEEEKKHEIISHIWAVQKEVEHLDSLLEEFVDYAKAPVIKAQTININHLLEQAIDFYKGECERNNIQLLVRLKPDLPKVKVDPNLIKRCLYNLISNAMQAMPEGGKLKISTFRKADSILINFTDTGNGIKEDKDNSIFDEFYSTKPKGTGLGLAIVRRIIESHNGDITYRNNRQKGVTFTLKLKKAGIRLIQNRI